MSSTKYLKFWSKGKKGKALSNFADLPVVIDERNYKTGEHAFNGHKYFTCAQLYDDGNKRKPKLLEYSNKFVGDEPEFPTALDAKRGGSKTKFKLKENEIEAWKTNSIETQKKINNYKYNTYPEVKDILEKYSEHVLLHQDNRAKEDTIWGAKITEDGLVGQNLLGKMWEETRNKMMGVATPTPHDVSIEPQEFVPHSPLGTPPPLPDPGDDPQEFVPHSPLESPPPLPDPGDDPQEFVPHSPLESPPPLPDPEVHDDDIPKPPIQISDDIPIGEQIEITHIEMPESKVEKKKKKKISIYNKNILNKQIFLHISEIGNNLTQLIEEKTKKDYENMCTNDGFIKKDSVELVTYSSGILENSTIRFDIVFEAMIFRPVEGMIIYNCLVENISRAGIKAKTNEEYSPVVIFIAKDHAYKSDYYNKITEGDKINIKVIGHRYELKDSKISIIASLVEKRNIKIELKK